MQTEYREYIDGGTTCEGYAAFDGSRKGKRPCVLVAHAWQGQSDVEREVAVRLAELGYVGFALDNYGKGVRGGLTEDNSKLMQPYVEDRGMLRRRLLAGLAAAKRHPQVDSERVAAIGYCFGGLCALDLARSAAPCLQGVVSFHGVLVPPRLGPQPSITAKVLVLHGYDDPMAPPDHVLAIAKELSDAGADWQLHAYGRTMHAFTFPGANMPERGLMYNASAARRSWLAMKNFLEEVLA